MLLNQKPSLPRLARRLKGHFRTGQLGKFFIHERHEFVCGLRLALLSTMEDSSDVAHEVMIGNEAPIESTSGLPSLC